MIDVKIITKAKQSGNGGGSSAKTTYINTTVSEADHASRADKAGKADKADYASKATSAQIATYAMKAGELDGNSETLKNYLYKGETTEKQTVKGEVDFAGKLTMDQIVSLLGGLSLGSSGAYSLSPEGNATLAKVFLSLLQSLDYDEATQTGFAFYKRKDGKYGLNITDLLVWGKAIFNSLEIRKLYSVGGNIVLSPSASKIVKVEEHYETDTAGEKVQTGWKCYLLADDGTMATTNQWMEGDQARCQTFNIAEGVYDNVGNKSYWRRITAVSTQNETIADAEGNVLYDGKKFAWVVLSKDDCETGSDTPQADDTIVCMGNRTNTDRQHLIMLETVGDSSPSLVLYRGVNSYSLENKAIFDVSYNGIKAVSKYFSFTGADGEKIWTPNYRGTWKEGKEYDYYDEVTWMGTRWLCLAPEGTPTTSEPSATNDLWRATTAIMEVTMEITQSLGEWIDKGEVNSVKCAVKRGFEDITDQVTSWDITRDSGDANNDAAWKNKDKARNFAGEIDIAWKDDDDDIGDSLSCLFTITAYGGNKQTLAQGTISV